jgi:hypothetical protein
MKVYIIIFKYIIIIFKYKINFFKSWFVHLKIGFHKWISNIGRKFFIGILITVLTGMLIRFLLREYLYVDVLIDIIEPIAIIYFTFMAIFSKFTFEVLADEIVNLIWTPNYMMPSDSVFPPSDPTRLPSDNLELPARIRNPAWNRPDPSTIPAGEAGKPFTAQYGRGEPMDIAIPDDEDKLHLHRIITLTHNYRTTRPFLPTDPQHVTMRDIFTTLKREGSGSNGYFVPTTYEDDRTFAVAKQLRKIIYNHPPFEKWINQHTNRVSWYYIKTTPNSELMVYLRGNFRNTTINRND